MHALQNMQIMSKHFQILETKLEKKKEETFGLKYKLYLTKEKIKSKDKEVTSFTEQLKKLKEEKEVATYAFNSTLIDLGKVH